MEKLKYLLLLFVAVLILPLAVFAEDEANNEATESKEADSKEVNIYFFRGEGCPHCEEAETWFKSIEEEMGDKFNIVDYETWYNEDNQSLMQKVAEARGEEAEGVPYIIVGDMSWNGFTESYEDEIKDQINKVFEQNVDERYDIMKYIKNPESQKKEEKSSSDAVALLLIIIVAGGIGFGIYKARQNTN